MYKVTEWLHTRQVGYWMCITGRWGCSSTAGDLRLLFKLGTWTNWARAVEEEPCNGAWEGRRERWEDGVAAAMGGWRPTDLKCLVWMEGAEFPSDLVGFTCWGGSVCLTPSTNLNQQTKIFSEMPAFSLNPKRPPGEERPGQTVSCDHIKNSAMFFRSYVLEGNNFGFYCGHSSVLGKTSRIQL